MKQTEANNGALGAYIAPVNHNKINSNIAVNISSNMMGRYAQDDDKDTSNYKRWDWMRVLCLDTVKNM
jgi:hypothetical protein